MKLLLKYILYTLLIVVLVSGTILLYRTHPEAQLAFIIPGLFILTLSRMSDDLNFRTFFPRWRSKEK
ncbi:hypothetical protein HDF24_06455 [Mucilaginibacter sp. X4EP1]|uniref:hypothetical protein n=1 Tax=Mucilaginibacter sp. X4EP1 TaxID=2723092 RepID=UPI002168BB03|nr:hypothetical protein [Mucilaginibacter sp. X4EP1]MCS3814258.1 hypothetical protein [Mucilaginibacter sp. X4EP1]